MVSLDRAGSYGTCRSVKVYDVAGFEFRFEFLLIVIDVIVDGVVIRTEIPVINCYMPKELKNVWIPNEETNLVSEGLVKAKDTFKDTTDPVLIMAVAGEEKLSKNPVPLAVTVQGVDEYNEPDIEISELEGMTAGFTPIPDGIVR